MSGGVLKGYRNRKVILFFVLLQLMVAYIIVINAWSLILLPSYTDGIYEKTMKYNPENTYTMWCVNDLFMGGTEEFIKFEEEIEGSVDQGDFVSYGTHFKTEHFIFDEEIMAGWTALLTEKFGEQSHRSEIILSDKSIYNLVTTQVIQGRELNDQDFGIEVGEIPVVVGYDLQNVIPVGTKYEAPVEREVRQKYHVVGVLSKGSKWPVTDFRKQKMIELDYRILSPFSQNTRDEFAMDITLRSNSMVLESEQGLKATMKSIKEISDRTKTQVIITRLSDEFEKEALRKAESIKNSVILSLILISVAVSGVIMTTISVLAERKYEIGVRMSVGYTRRNIWNMVLADLILTNLIGLIFAYGFVFVQQSQSVKGNYEYTYEILKSTNLLLYVFGTMVLVLFISMIIPKSIINKFNVVDLIRRED